MKNKKDESIQQKRVRGTQQNRMEHCQEGERVGQRGINTHGTRQFSGLQVPI